MKVLRRGGEFARFRINRYGAISIFVCASALLTLVLLRAFGRLSLVLALAIAFLALRLGRPFFTKWANWSRGVEGEAAVIEALSSLPDDYALVNDLTLPDRRGNIDHFLVGPNGLFVLETKNYSGEIECRDDDWFVNGRVVNSLSRQAKGNALAVRDSLTAMLPGLESLQNRFVVAVLVFVNPKASLNLRYATIPVARLGELADFIRSYPCKGPIPLKDRRDIVFHLLSAHSIASEMSR